MEIPNYLNLSYAFGRQLFVKHFERKKEKLHLISLRDAISIAQKQPTPPTYEQALRIVNDIDENLYKFCSSQLSKKNENDTVKLFRELADAETGGQFKMDQGGPFCFGARGSI